MAQIIKSKNKEVLGTISTLATLAGTITGQPFLTALGSVTGGVNNLMNGGDSSSSQSQQGGLLDTLQNIANLGKTLSSSNIAKTNEQNAQEKIQEMASRGWTPNNGYYTTPGWINQIYNNGWGW